jgi:hypothetical protein
MRLSLICPTDSIQNTENFSDKNLFKKSFISYKLIDSDKWADQGFDDIIILLSVCLI